MTRIFLPTMAAKKSDIEGMLRLLERTAGKDIGLEIIGVAGHFQDGEVVKEIISNVNSVAKGVPTIVHGFSGLDVYKLGTADMRTDAGKGTLNTYLDIAKHVGSHYVHVHGAAGYKGKQKTREEKIPELRAIRRNLLSCLQNATCPIGIENLPTPSAGDYDANPETVWRDCAESIGDCLEVVDGTNLRITFDTCHYATDRREEEIDLIAPLKRLGDKCRYLHVSDVVGFCEQPNSVWTEGVVPGEGRIGNDSFEKLFRYIRENRPNIEICVEVANKDFKNPVESEETIKRIRNWLR